VHYSHLHLVKIGSSHARKLLRWQRAITSMPSPQLRMTPSRVFLEVACFTSSKHSLGREHASFSPANLAAGKRILPVQQRFPSSRNHLNPWSSSSSTQSIESAPVTVTSSLCRQRKKITGPSKTSRI